MGCIISWFHLFQNHIEGLKKFESVVLSLDATFFRTILKASVLLIIIIIKLILLKNKSENRKILNIRMTARHCQWRGRSGAFHKNNETRHWQWRVSSKSRASEMERRCTFCIYSGAFYKNNETRHCTPLTVAPYHSYIWNFTVLTLIFNNINLIIIIITKNCEGLKPPALYHAWTRARIYSMWTIQGTTQVCFMKWDGLLGDLGIMFGACIMHMLLAVDVRLGWVIMLIW
jgi:hypothetical protein